MAKTGPIILIDDDKEDEELMRDALEHLGIKNQLIHFGDCDSAFDFLQHTTENPLIIISDINLPKKTGIEFKKQLDEDPLLRSKSIPFVFLSTSIDQNSVDIAYKELTVQGFFQKSNSFQDYTTVIKVLIDYWKFCRHPNS